MQEINVYMADDHAIVVDGLREILKANPAIRVLGTASNGLEIQTLMRQRWADVVILDINMPKMNGLECTEWIKKTYPNTKVIILTMFPERSYVDQLISAGADGCLLKSRGSKDLLEAIERVTEGKSYFDTVRDFTSREEKTMLNLSAREIEIIRMVVNGSTSAQIAEQLFLSEHTVKTHRKNIFRKLGINSISQLTSFAINRQLLP